MPFGRGFTAVQDAPPFCARFVLHDSNVHLVRLGCTSRRPASVVSRTGRFREVDRADPTPVDLLEEIRAALDAVDPLLCGRVVDIEMSRLRVVTDPTLFRRMFARLITTAIAQSQPPNSITVRVARTRKSARIEVINEGSPLARDDLGAVTRDAEESRSLRAQRTTNSARHRRERERGHHIGRRIARITF